MREIRVKLENYPRFLCGSSQEIKKAHKLMQILLPSKLKGIILETNYTHHLKRIYI